MIDVNLDAINQCVDMSWMTAEQALVALGTKAQTLYANVSRGRIEAKPDPADSRRSLYRRSDIERLAEHHRGRRKATEVAAQAISWGEPVLPTAISTVSGGRLYYRGHDAAALAAHMSLEAVAKLLWQAPKARFQSDIGSSEGGVAGAFGVLAMMAARDLPSLGRSANVLKGEAEHVVGGLASAMAGHNGEGAALHERLAGHWKRPDAADAIRRALVLLAEHELNASTFAARIAASTGAALSASVLAGLATLSGPLHGGASVAMRELAASAQRDGAEETVRQYLTQGRALPCFGHRLYPDGDVRAQALLECFEPPAVFSALAAVALRTVGELPNIDFALAAMTEAFDLPADAPLILFTLGRSVGWLAHALEQIENGKLIRPRAQYVGPPI